MVFSSIPFLFYFLPFCLILYYIVPFSLKNHILLIFSLVFYAWGEPIYILLMLFASFVDYLNGRLMGKFGKTKPVRRIFLFLSVFINLSMLAFFKYADFLISSVNSLLHSSIPLLHIGLPIGISFFTFQTMSYIIDLYKGEVEMERNYLTYLTYVSMFPQLIAGPIVRFSTVNEELHKRVIDRKGFIEGTVRFLQGLFKKTLLANNIGAVWEEIRLVETGGLHSVSALCGWLGIICFTLQLYFDFSAYSDMAIGMGKMLGFHYLENFRYPLFAVSVTDYWRRWHISLGTWFRDYVYIPLGGNRHGKAHHLRNLMIVWFLTGLWHGAAWNFVLWGLYYGVLLSLEKYIYGGLLDKLPRVFRHFYACFIVVFGFVIFVFDSLNASFSYMQTIFMQKGNALAGTDLLWHLTNNLPLIIICLILSCPVYPVLRKMRERVITTYNSNGLRIFFLFMSIAFYILLFLLSTACLVNDSYNPFLYFRF